MRPSRVINRLLVIVYVEVSQSRNGRTTHHTNTTSASSQTTQLAMLLSARRTRKIATANVTTSTRAGKISAFGWVRVSTTIDSPSVSSFGEMATEGVSHLSGSDFSDR